MVARRLLGRTLLAPSLLAVSVVGLALAASLGPPAEQGAAGQAPAATVVEGGCAPLTRRLCEDVGAGSSACRLARREIARLSEARCAGMLARYADVRRELDELDLGVRTLTAPEQLSGQGAAPRVGAPGAPLTLALFCDFQSPECGRASPMARMVSNLHGDRVRLVFRQYPSTNHPHALLAAEASLAAHAQGRFWEYHDVLFSNPQDLSRPALERYAAAVGLDLPAFRRALDDHTYAADVGADVALGHRVQALDRPSLFANGKRVPVPYGAVELARLIDSELTLR